jgi:tyrosyl-tRNA synthetase
MDLQEKIRLYAKLRDLSHQIIINLQTLNTLKNTEEIDNIKNSIQFSQDVIKAVYSQLFTPTVEIIENEKSEEK